MRIGYVRVSSLDQNPDRQIDELKLHQVEKVFMDKVSGKNLDRLARNLADLLTMVQDLTGRGVSVTFLNERLSFESGKDAFPMLRGKIQYPPGGADKNLDQKFTLTLV